MAEAHYRPPNLLLATLGLSLATFMRVLDTTIANVSLPTIAGNLGVSYNQSTWVITSFTVCMAISLPLTGFLARRFGEVKLFVWCTLLFSLTSLMCGLSQSMGMLLLFRAIQGAVAGPMYPVTQSLLIAVYPSEKRGMALALMAMVTVVAPIVGPTLGGWITDNYNWPWIFFINVPIGIFASVVIGAQLAGKKEVTERPRVDYVGLIALVVGVGALQIVLDKGNDADWFHSTFIVMMSIVAAIGMAVFVIWELTDARPDRGPEAVPAPQLHLRHDPADPVLLDVLLDGPAAAAVAAAHAALHRDLGRPGRRLDRHRAGAADVSSSASTRRAPTCAWWPRRRSWCWR